MQVSATRFFVWMAVLYVALTILLAYPLSIHPGDAVTSATQDTDLYIWTFAWDAHAFITHPLSIFDANIYYPFHNTLAYSENLIGGALLVAPVEWITHNPVLAMNLAALMTAPLSALGAYLLARRLGIGRPGAALCGIIYGFAPSRFLRLDQAHLAAVEWIPYSLAYAHAYLTGGRKRDLRLAVAFFTAQALTSGHGAVFLTAALFGLVVYRVGLGGPAGFITGVRDLGVTGVVLLMPAFLILIPYGAAQAEAGLRRDLSEWVGSWANFLSSPTHVDEFVIKHFMPIVDELAGASLFPGWLPILLAVAAFLWPVAQSRSLPARQDRGWPRLALTLDFALLVLLLLALYLTVAGGDRFQLGGVVVSLRSPGRVWLLCLVVSGLRLAITRPAPLDLQVRTEAVRRWCRALRSDMRTFYLLIVFACAALAVGPPDGVWRLVYWLPGLNFIRIPSRFMILGTLGVAVLSGFGFDRVAARLGSTGRTILAIVLGCALVAEFSAVPFGLVEEHAEIPPIDRWLDTQAKPFAIAEVPVPDSGVGGVRAKAQSIFMLHTMAHWQKTVYGFSGLEPHLSDEVYWKLTRFPDETSLRALSELGVKYVVVHTDLYVPGDWPKVEERLTTFSSELRLEHVEGDGRVYSVISARPMLSTAVQRRDANK